MGQAGVGMPANIKLNQFGRIIYQVFGDWPFHVGSSLKTTQWRDVDVRLILSDDEYKLWFGDFNGPALHNPKWQGLCLAFSQLGADMTGLPIDFQIQSEYEANKFFTDGERSALILCGELGQQPRELGTAQKIVQYFGMKPGTFGGNVYYYETEDESEKYAVSISWSLIEEPRTRVSKMGENGENIDVISLSRINGETYVFPLEALASAGMSIKITELSCPETGIDRVDCYHCTEGLRVK